jgi:predicted Zn finger-like uncharacterized protein
MRTTCPECRTTFRVTQAQLGARRGLVRCGQCRAVFNAYDTLLPELEEPSRVAESAPAAVEETRPGSAGPATAALPDPGAAAAVPTRPFAHDDAAEDAATTAAAVPPVSADAAADADSPPEDSPDAILLSELPHRRPAPARPWRAGAQWLAVVMLTSALLLQGVLYLRAPLVDAYPDARPWLQALCQPLRCQVPLPRQLDKRALVASSLEHDPERKSRVRLTFLLANPTARTQTWPHVSLTLTDVRETPVARKLFPPEVYLPAEVDRAAGMPAQAEREVRIDLDIGNLAASGYTLDVLYP